MKTRTIEEIERAFREMGLTEETWGRTKPSATTVEPSTTSQVFIRIETTTTPLKEKTHADLA